MSKLREVDGDEDEEAYTLRPYGLLFMKLGSEELAMRACEALELYMRRFKRAIEVDDDGLHFTDGFDEEDHAILSRAILWHDLADAEGNTGKEAIQNLHDACQAAREKTWRKRREETENQ